MLFIGLGLGVLAVGLGLVGFVYFVARHGHAEIHSSNGPTVELNGTPSGIAVTTVPTATPSTIEPPPPVTTKPPAIPMIPGMTSGGRFVTAFIVAQNNPALQSDVQTQFNAHIADELSRCLPEKAGAISLMVKVKPDGSVSQVNAIMGVGTWVNCITSGLKESHFVATPKGGEVMMSLSWQK